MDAFLGTVNTSKSFSGTSSGPSHSRELLNEKSFSAICTDLGMADVLRFWNTSTEDSIKGWETLILE
ncbi:hypothetical protein Tco_0877608 [Tanacetum coccineum]|uniref:Uncharacterized protein n=1 Tax=Tanacetum coccineum TaxID=301880 RepID=A0ABQ5BYJ0_9ASTR